MEPIDTNGDSEKLNRLRKARRGFKVNGKIYGICMLVAALVFGVGYIYGAEGSSGTVIFSRGLLMIVALCVIGFTAGFWLFLVFEFLFYLWCLAKDHFRYSLLQLMVFVFLCAMVASLAAIQENDKWKLMVGVGELVLIILYLIRSIIIQDPLNESEGFVYPMHGDFENVLKKLGRLVSRRGIR